MELSPENRYHDLLLSQQTLLFASASLDGIPEISVTPFVLNEGCFYILVSDLAGHTANLRHNPKVSVIFTRSEAETKNLFARERAIFNCLVREVAGSDPVHDKQLQALTTQFGETVTLLRTLPDFHLFELQPRTARYVLGFGQAYQINLDDKRFNLITRSTS